MKITIHRGSQEVGGSCVEIQSSRSRIIIDVGMPLFDRSGKSLDFYLSQGKTLGQLKADGVVADVPGLFQDSEEPSLFYSPTESSCPINGILLSHAHLDHCGLLAHTRPEIPVYASVGTSKMMLAGSIFASQTRLPRDRYRELQSGSPTEIGDITITSFPVDHSIFGCMALLIEADGKSIFYTGDVRLHGRKPGMMKALVEKLCPRTIDAVLMEGTHFGFPDGEKLSEYDLEDKIVNLVTHAPGLVLASFSPQNVDRLVCFIRTAIKTNRTFVVDLYTAFIMHLLSTELDLPQPGRDFRIRTMISKTYTASKVKRLQKIIDQVQESEIEWSQIAGNRKDYLMVFRPSMISRDFDNHLPEKSLCLYSRWKGYLQQPEWRQVKDQLESTQGTLEVLHTSGHIFSDDIVTFVKSMSPRKVIPIHTFDPKEFENQFENVQLLSDQECYEVV